MRCTHRTVIASAGMGVTPRAQPVRAQIGSISVRRTLIDRALEDRSAVDIAKDTEIVMTVNAVMAEVGTIKASTEIYEQRPLIRGVNVKRLYWLSFT